MVGVIFAFGFGLCLIASRWGMHPLDSPIIFDGAWRLMHGQSYFHDFNTPNGFVPIGMQVVFFKVLGVNWWAYRLHAAMMNGLFGLLAFGILCKATGKRTLAMAYGCLSTIVFYPPMGTPYMEQHSYFFLLLGVFLAILTSQMMGWKRFLFTAAIPITWVLAILSKQSPGFFAIPLSLVTMLLFWEKVDFKRALIALAAGLPGILVTFWLFVGWPFGIEAEFWRYFWTYPQAIGAERAAQWHFGIFKSIRSFAWLPFQTLSGWNLVFRYLLYVPFLAFGIEWLWRKWRKTGPIATYPFRYLVVAILMVVVCSFFMHSTLNQKENGIPLVFVSIGLGHAFWAEWLTSKLGGLTWPEKRRTRIALGASLLLLGLSVYTAIEFDQRVNRLRLVLDFPPDVMQHEEMRPKAGISDLGFVVPYGAGQLEPGMILDWARVHDGTFLLMGDITWLYGLSGRPSVPPFLWMHEGLTMPRLDDPAFAQTDLDLLQSILQHHVKYVIFENASRITYMGLQLECFPATADAIYARHIATETVGGYVVWHLRY